MKYRTNTEIMEAMLRSIKSGATKTQIMYGAYLSYSQLTMYLRSMEKNGLVIFDSQLRLYRITEKGVRFMDLCDMINVDNPLSEKEVAPEPAIVESITNLDSSEKSTFGAEF